MSKLGWVVTAMFVFGALQYARDADSMDNIRDKRRHPVKTRSSRAAREEQRQRSAM